MVEEAGVPEENHRPVINIFNYKQTKMLLYTKLFYRIQYLPIWFVDNCVCNTVLFYHGRIQFAYLKEKCQKYDIVVVETNSEQQ